jgi:hypothetical protein
MERMVPEAEDLKSEVDICAVYESIVGQMLEGAATCWKYSTLRGSRS